MLTTSPEFAPEGLCAQTDPEMFFATAAAEVTAARRVCLACPARVRCRTWAMDTEEPRDRYGILGAMTAAERSYWHRHPELAASDVIGRPPGPSTVEAVEELLLQGLALWEIAEELMLTRTPVAKLASIARARIARREQERAA